MNLLVDDLVERVLDESGCAGTFEGRDEVADLLFAQNHFGRHPCRVAEGRDGGRVDGGEKAEDFGLIRHRDVHFEPDELGGVHGSGEQNLERFDLEALPFVGHGGVGGHEPCGAGEELLDDAQVVGAERVSGLGVDDDGVGNGSDLDLAGAPAEVDVGVDAVGFAVALGEADVFGGDPLAFEVLDRADF